VGENNYLLLAHLEELLGLGQPLVVGLSRKSFLGQTAAGGKSPLAARERGSATLAANTAAILAGAHGVRVHEVRAAVEAARVADAILAGLAGGCM
jgi:dihydropteroate synthase